MKPTPVVPLLALLGAFAAPAAQAAIADFGTCGATLREAALGNGMAAERFDRLFADVAPDPSVLTLLDAQPEFTTPVWDYLAALVDEQRIADGRAMLATHRELLDRLAGQYGVDPATVVAVWGVESDYGRVTGKRPLLQSLATLSCNGRRQPFFRGELLALLTLIDGGDLGAEGLTGSWAGAFGQTQFMPSTYARIAVDGDGDGRRDLVASIPDALASTANYLKRAGWRSGQPWGVEVRLPAGFDATLAGRGKRRPLSAWRTLGLVLADGTPLQVPTMADDSAAALLLPAGAKGPALLAFRNYDAIYSYNAAESYALAIATLADRLRGGGGLATAWPTDDPGLGRNERRELQTLLLARGHPIGSADGMVGDATRRAIRIEQQRLGWPDADGRAGTRILQALRDATPPVATAFKLPANHAQLIQSPIVRSRIPMKDVQGLSAGDFNGFAAWKVETPFSTAAISVFGGQLLSFVPKDGVEVMWLSPLAKQPPTPIRGGSPVCWPYFARQGQGNDVPSHGFVRTVPWELRDARRESDGTMVLTLAPPAMENLSLRLTMTLRIGRVLEQELLTENTGSQPVAFTQALHNYFNVSDALAVDVGGLDGLTYLDKLDGGNAHVQQGDWNLRDPRDPGRSDRIYTAAGGRYELRDPGFARRIAISTEGSHSAVLWNAGEQAAQRMQDIGAGWRNYVCIEAANVGPDVIELAPGGRHVLKQVFEVKPL
ncbi:lytic murein transglycosylase [Stenotrophomonas sp. NLF4-10]|uniref:lytic murein transglycosylase n=1 Tax=Stenotrophomonas sp. NLF4-10 TaxID=2918754 RepID=UPI001EFB3B54|nr:lytic murein transglycosylase [Stenotrophomonas sp. NLF4-10]MCG8275055.1 lytic murein transglycosylase [Stenotrophomonas sp. NLF4-10]